MKYVSWCVIVRIFTQPLTYFKLFNCQIWLLLICCPLMSTAMTNCQQKHPQLSCISGRRADRQRHDHGALGGEGVRVGAGVGAPRPAAPPRPPARPHGERPTPAPLQGVPLPGEHSVWSIWDWQYGLIPNF